VKKINTVLAVLVAALFLTSAFAYHRSEQRGERFERGQRFLPNLNPDRIAEITLEKGETTTRLRRDGDRFLVASAGGYPAKTEEVNRLLRDLLDVRLEKEVGEGEELQGELELTGEEEGTLEVTLEDDAGKEMLRFLVGKAFEGEGGGGNYIRRAEADGGPIYLTSSRVYFDATDDDYLDKEILDVEAEKVTAVRGPGYELAREDGGELELVDVPSGKKASAKVDQLKRALSPLRFTKHHLADAPEVQGLSFEPPVVFDLDDGSGYQVEVAEKDGEHFLRIAGFHRTGQVQIAMDADEEEVRETSEQLVRADEIQSFNEFHGSWIYQVSESTADKFRLDRGELLEDG
jgi:hypothetical protein